MRNFFMILALVVAFAGGCLGGGVANNGVIRTVQDPFLGEVKGFSLYLDRGGYTAIGATRSKEGTKLELLVVGHGVSDTVAAVGDRSDFLVNGTPLTLANSVEARGVSNATPSQIFTQWKVTFQLDEAQVQTLATGALTAIKVRVGADEYILSFDAKQSRTVQSNMAELGR